MVFVPQAQQHFCFGSVSQLKSLGSLQSGACSCPSGCKAILDREFGGWRHCGDDGNTFYRSVGFAMVEAILRGGPEEIQGIVRTLQAVGPGGRQRGLEHFLVSLSAMNRADALQEWYRVLLHDRAMDHQLVICMRQVSARFLAQNPRAHLNGVPLGVAVEKVWGMAASEFIQQVILRDGVEANQLTLALVPMAFQFRLEVMWLGLSEPPRRFEVRYNWCNTEYVSTGHFESMSSLSDPHACAVAPCAVRAWAAPGAPFARPDHLREPSSTPEGEGGRPAIVLLARSGSYNICYSLGAAKEIASMQEEQEGESCGSPTSPKSPASRPAREEGSPLPSAWTFSALHLLGAAMRSPRAQPWVSARISGVEEEFWACRCCPRDGNTFYRAAGFAMVEGTLLREDTGRARSFLETLQSVDSDGSQTRGLQELLASIMEMDGSHALGEWYSKLLCDPGLDAQLARGVRLACASFLAQNADATLNEMRLADVVKRFSDLPLEEFIAQKILQDGVDADRFTLALAPMAFRLDLGIIQVDPCVPTERFEVRYHWANTQYIQVGRGAASGAREGRGGGAVATLLSRPGNYDILYSHKVAREIAQVQESLGWRDAAWRADASLAAVEADPDATVDEGDAEFKLAKEQLPASPSVGHAAGGRQGTGDVAADRRLGDVAAVASFEMEPLAANTALCPSTDSATQTSTSGQPGAAAAWSPLQASTTSGGADVAAPTRSASDDQQLGTPVASQRSDQLGAMPVLVQTSRQSLDSAVELGVAGLGEATKAGPLQAEPGAGAALGAALDNPSSGCSRQSSSTRGGSKVDESARSAADEEQLGAHAVAHGQDQPDAMPVLVQCSWQSLDSTVELSPADRRASSFCELAADVENDEPAERLTSRAGKLRPVPGSVASPEGA